MISIYSLTFSYNFYIHGFSEREKMKAIIVYMSTYGHVEQMAGKVMQGLEEEGIEVVLSKAPETDPEELLNYDAVIFGSPVRMGSVDHALKAFIEKTGGLWLKAALKNRIGGVFVSGGNYNSGVETTQMALYGTLLELGLVMVGFVNDMPGYGKGANQWGPVAMVGLDGTEGPSDETLTACAFYGRRLGGVIKKFCS